MTVWRRGERVARGIAHGSNLKEHRRGADRRPPRRLGKRHGNDRVVVRQVVDFRTVSPPERMSCALVADANRSVATGKRTHVNLMTAGLVRRVDDPPPV